MLVKYANFVKIQPTAPDKRVRPKASHLLLYGNHEVQKDCQNRKRETGYMPFANCPFLKDCILKITVFHVAMVLTKRRRERWR